MGEKEISPDIQALAEQAKSRIIPAKSKDAYIKEYEKFVKWMELKKAKNVDETLMLAYTVPFFNAGHRDLHDKNFGSC
jgi:hypothetical protein